MSDRRDDGYECVEPDLGRQLWRLEEPDTGQEEARPLREHLRICDACRLRRAILSEVAQGLASGRLGLAGDSAGRSAPSRRRARTERLLAGSGGLAAAACLALLLLVPPAPVGGDRIERGDGAPTFRRPVEGEVLIDRTPRLSWRPVEGASRYRLEVTAVGGDYHWRTETEATAATVPADSPLPDDARLRAVLAPVPADLAAPGELSVAFRTGDVADLLHHRLAMAGPGVLGLGLASLLLLLGALIVRLAPRPARA